MSSPTANATSPSSAQGRSFLPLLDDTTYRYPCPRRPYQIILYAQALGGSGSAQAESQSQSSESSSLRFDPADSALWASLADAGGAFAVRFVRVGAMSEADEVGDEVYRGPERVVGRGDNTPNNPNPNDPNINDPNNSSDSDSDAAGAVLRTLGDMGSEEAGPNPLGGMVRGEDGYERLRLTALDALVPDAPPSEWSGTTARETAQPTRVGSEDGSGSGSEAGSRAGRGGRSGDGEEGGRVDGRDGAGTGPSGQ